MLGFLGVVHDQRLGPLRIQRWKHHTTSKKALHKQGPMPTDHGLTLVKPPALPAEQVVHDACDRTVLP